MCVIAGYIGNEKAAPILLKMLRREEGLDAGFYTGIATIHEGKLHYRKGVGDIETLLAQTDALELPGTIGIAHSRTPSGGGREWAHPFTDANEQLAYVANGAPGKYVATTDLSKIGSRLLQKGAQFKSAQSEKVGASPVLSDGRSVHLSDVLCQLIADNFKGQEISANGLLQAAIETYETAPGEIVGLCIHATQPDSIVVARHNQPMQIGRGSDGALYLATTTMAFPEVVWQMRVPAVAGAICHRDGSVQVTPFGDHSRLIPLGAFPSADAIAATIQKFVREKNPCTMPDLAKAIEPLWSDGFLRERAIVVYELLAALQREGKITCTQKRIPGMLEQGTVPRTFIEFEI
jgi:glutamine phosphoribosylpyrophosphate amidotransferase